MLDGFLGRGFSSKCKSLIKLLRRRIEIIKRKRNSMIRFFNRDIAELIKSGRDLNAYGRAEGLIVEMNLSCCYDLVDQFCGCILEQLSSMQKERDCPKECREAVSSLMYAAARFADLTELRELRSIFTERYGNTLASFVNQEFAKKLEPEPPSVDQKLHLMQEISPEFSIKWDSKAAKVMVSSPSESAQDPPKKCEPLHDGEDETVIIVDKEDISSHQEQEKTLGTLYTTREDENTDGKDIGSIAGENDHRQFGTNKSNLQEPSEYVKPHLKNIIPPYVKPGGSKYGTTNWDVSGGDSIAKRLPDQDNSLSDSKPKPRSVRTRPLKPPVIDNDATAVGTEHNSSSSKGQEAHGAQESIPTCFVNHVERANERLLMSVRRPSNHESSKLKSGLNAPPHAAEAGDFLLSTKNDAACLNLDSAPRTRAVSSDSAPPHIRAVSLPPEHMASTKVEKVPVRAASFHPDNSSEGHVHPKLPDYDDLAARFASLKGRRKG